MTMAADLERQPPVRAAAGPRVVVVVLTYGGADYAADACRSLLRSESCEYRLIFIDNASPDNTFDSLRAFAAAEGIDHQVTAPDAPGADFEAMPRLTLMQSGANLGFAGGNNVAVRWLMRGRGWDYLWLLNPDTLVEPQTMAALAARGTERPDAGIIGARICCDPDRDVIQNYAGGKIWKVLGVGRNLGLGAPADAPVDVAAIEAELDFVVGCSMFVPRRFLEEVGLMEEGYFLYYEEFDWCLRRGDYALAYAHDAIVYHRLGAAIGSSTKRGGISPFSMFWNIRNRFKVAHRFYPYYLPTVYLGCWLEILRMASAKSWRNIGVILTTMHGLKTRP